MSDAGHRINSMLKSPHVNGAIAASPSTGLLSLDENSRNALFYCAILALQFGLQPMIANKFTPSGVSRSSVVIATELAKIVFAVLTIMTGPSAEIEKIRESWSIANSLKIAALPATLYSIQNLFVQHGYFLVDSMTFNLLNQTKTLSAAFWLYVIMGQPQSGIQMVALLMLLAAAVMLNAPTSGSQSTSAISEGYNLGLLLVASASMLSGLSASLTQRALVGSKPRHSVFFSAELAVYGIFFLLGNLMFNNDIKGGGFALFSNWKLYTLIPVITNAFGGIVVGQVTKYAGGVVKGFALIAGLIVTGVAQWLIDGKPLGYRDLVAVVLVSTAIYLHSKYPVPKKDKKVEEKKD